MFKLKISIGSFGKLEDNSCNIIFERYHNYHFIFNNDTEEVIRKNTSIASFARR